MDPTTGPAPAPETPDWTPPEDWHDPGARIPGTPPHPDDPPLHPDRHAHAALTARILEAARQGPLTRDALTARLLEAAARYGPLPRAEVYARITAEGEYAAATHDVGVSHPPVCLADADKPLELWLQWMSEYLAEARRLATIGYSREGALGYLRRALSCGVNAAIYHGLPPREPGGP